MSNSNLEVCGKAQPGFLQQTQAVNAGQTSSCWDFQGNGGALNCRKPTCPGVMSCLGRHENKQLEKKKIKADEITQRARVLATKPDDLSSVLSFTC